MSYLIRIILATLTILIPGLVLYLLARKNRDNSKLFHLLTGLSVFWMLMMFFYLVIGPMFLGIY